MNSFRIVMLVGFGGAVGACARYWLSGLCGRWFGQDFPYGTLGVNVLGCFLLGLLAHILQQEVISEVWRLPLAIGFLGSLTTFSTFGCETFKLLESSNWPSALANIGSQLALGLLAVWGGATVARMVVGGPT